MKMRAKGLEKSRVCGRRSRFQTDFWTLRRRQERPDAFSMMPLPFSSDAGTSMHGKGLTYRSMMVMIGATSAPALAAAATSDPTLHGRSFVFHCFCSLLRGGVLDCRIGRLGGNDTEMEGLLSRTGGELATGSAVVALQPTSRVIEWQWVHICKI